MRITWSRWDQLSLEGLLWALPALVLLRVVVSSVRALQGEALTSTGHLPDGLVQAAGVVRGPLTGSVVVEDPTAAQSAWALVPGLVLLVVAVVCTRLLLGVVRSLRGGSPFTTRNARRLTSLGVVVVVGGLAVQLVDSVAHARTIAPLLPDGPTTWQLDLQLWPLVAVSIVLGFLAEVFSRGARMREDVEGLV